MEFESLEQLKELFASGQFTFPEEMMVAGIKYKSSKTSEHSIKKMIENGYKAMWIYFTPYREQSQEAGLNHAIVFLWGFPANTLKMVPYDVRTTSKARVDAGAIVEKMDNGDSVSIPKEKIVGDVVDIIITSLHGTQPIKGKIDTGADVSSLHADDWKINNGQVTFTSPDLSENQITMPVIEKQAIKSSNGDTEYRPVIELNIKINEQELTNCMFNLNDRGSMTYPILVGQNVLEAGGFMIDPTINDPDVMSNEDIEVDWDALQEEYEDDVISEFVSNDKNELVEKVIDFIKNEN